jgi:hypothetical protein
MDGGSRGSRLESFLLGGLVGAAGALATARRLRPKPRRRVSPAGLAAFEQAPCFQEIVEDEQATGRARSRRP